MRATVLLLVIAFFASACASQPITDDSQATVTTGAAAVPLTSPSTTAAPTIAPGPETELAAARASWAAAGLATYSYLFFDDCGECDQLPVQEAVVWDGDVIDPLRRVASIEEAFALIEAALARGDDVEVAYHPELGYPTDLWIDKEARAYDGGTHLVFSSVEPGLPGDPASLDRHLAAKAQWDAAGLGSYEYSSAVICGCEFQVSMRTSIVDGLVTEFDARPPEPTDITFSPLTISQLFEDVEEMLSGQDFESEGIRVTGSARYDEEYGYPIWIGLDIDVLDPQAAAEAEFPSRLVMTVSDLVPLEPDPSSEARQARAKWSAAGLDTYIFDIVFHDVEAGDFTDEFTVEVVDDVVVSVVQNGYEYPPEDVEVTTIDGIFDMLSKWEVAGSSLDVIYNVELGYPAVVVAVHPDGSSGVFSISLRR